MISPPDRRQAVALIDEAVAAGARQHKACEVLEISARTYQRWTVDGGVREDQRPLAKRARPANALTPEEERAILAACHRPAFASLPPEQAVQRATFTETSKMGSVPLAGLVEAGGWGGVGEFSSRILSTLPR